MVITFEEQFPDGPDGQKADIYYDVVGRYLIRAWNSGEYYTQVFDTQQECGAWIDEFESDWDNIIVFKLSALYKHHGEILWAELT